MIRTLVFGILLAAIPGLTTQALAQETPSLADVAAGLQDTAEESIEAIIPDLDTDTLALTESAKADQANWRPVSADRLLVFETTKGRVVIEMFPEISPLHVAQFSTIARTGDYDGTSFHRVIEDFMAQGGDVFALHGRESGLPNVPAEFSFRRDPAQMEFDMLGDADRSNEGYYKGLPMRTQSKWMSELNKDGMVDSSIPHCQGVVSSARLGNDVNSANAQFFLLRAHSPWLDREYSPWGRILEGQDAVLSMKVGEPVVNPDILTRAYIVADLPEGEQLKAWVQRTDGPAFAATLSDNAEAEVCDLPAVPSVVEG